jgi:FixJ family two-component response regulator
MAIAVPELLERAHLVDALEAALADAAHGAGRLVLVRGEAGVGKTALLRRGGRPVSRPRPLGRLQNREIASQLVVSPKTVEHHVSAILRKLEVPTRRDAAAAAPRLGL